MYILGGAKFAQRSGKVKAALNWVCNLIWVLIFLLALGGCSAIDVATGYVVNEYCMQPQSARVALREAINVSASPHHVRIDCKGDNPNFFTSSQ